MTTETKHKKIIEIVQDKQVRQRVLFLVPKLRLGTRTLNEYRRSLLVQAKKGVPDDKGRVQWGTFTENQKEVLT